MMLPCLTHNLNLVDVSIFLMTSLTTLFSYMSLIADYSLEGGTYFPSMEMCSAWLHDALPI